MASPHATTVLGRTLRELGTLLAVTTDFDECPIGGSTERPLPRLLYVADVPVESSYHGSTLIYRLLQAYPPEKLLVVEHNLQPSLPERRLPKVRYAKLASRALQCANTRLNPLVASWLMLTAGWRIRHVQRSIRDFEPEAVLTVAHGYSWLAAAAFAQSKNLALHLIVHDDWPNVTPVWGFGPLCRGRRFGAIYKQAASRLCVSPSMVEAYRRRYGVEGALLYPARAAEALTDPRINQGDCPRRTGYPSAKSAARVPRNLTGAYAGTVNSQGYFDALAALARQLDRVGGKLLIFGPLERSVAGTRGLTMSNVEFRGLLPSSCLISICRKEADFLFLPMSFDTGERPNMELSFPSKLADYSAMNLPLLIRGPVYCSAARWARENPGVAITVDTESGEALSEAIAALSSAEARKILAARARRIGDVYFDHARAQKILFDALTSPTQLAWVAS